MKTGIPECWKLQAAKHGAGARDHVSPAAKPCRCLGLEAAHVTCALPLPASNQLIGRWVKITMDASKISVGGCGPFGPFDPPPPHTHIYSFAVWWTRSALRSLFQQGPWNECPSIVMFQCVGSHGIHPCRPPACSRCVEGAEQLAPSICIPFAQTVRFCAPHTTPCKAGAYPIMTCVFFLAGWSCDADLCTRISVRTLCPFAFHSWRCPLPMHSDAFDRVVVQRLHASSAPSPFHLFIILAQRRLCY